MNNVFIGGSATVFPQPLSSIYIADKLYPTNLCSEQINKLAKRAARKFGIKERSLCLDLERIPDRVLATREHHSLSMNFHVSDIIRFDETGFVLDEQVKNLVPSLVSDSVIKPILSKHSLLSNNILEWSIHQGGTKVLSAFAKPEILGLSNAQIARAKHFFENFGNMSSPSCFLVFHSFFKEQCKDKRGELGMIVGFGAGLYQFSLLYRWA